MSTQHTPGPWVYARDFVVNEKRAKVTTIAVCCDFVIGLPAIYEGGNYRDGDPSGDPEADARLIAAAPDLLDALELCKSNISSLLASAHPKVYGEWLDAVSAALAKAKGAA